MFSFTGFINPNCVTSYDVLMPEDQAAALCSGDAIGSVVDKTVGRQNRY